MGYNYFNKIALLVFTRFVKPSGLLVFTMHLFAGVAVRFVLCYCSTIDPTFQLTPIAFRLMAFAFGDILYPLHRGCVGLTTFTAPPFPAISVFGLGFTKRLAQGCYRLAPLGWQ